MHWKEISYERNLLLILLTCTALVSSKNMIESSFPSPHDVYLPDSALMFKESLMHYVPPSGDFNYLLPTHVQPINYKIKLITSSGNKPENFEGEVEILVNIKENSTNITLHYVNITVKSTSVADNENMDMNVNSMYNNITNFYVIQSETEPFRENINYTIKINYIGIHSDDMTGFFRISYTDGNNNTRWLTTTYFEPTYARKAFPCFDEPAFKATFEISIKKVDGKKIISNMPLKSTLQDPEWDNFEKTPVMSTYLIAFLISDYENVENEDKTFRIWAREDFINQTYFALEVSQHIMHALEEFLLGIKYQFPKMDQVAIPNFPAGAMENLGLVTYMEEYLLNSNTYTTSIQREQIITTMSHEFAHQWFGNLVTLEWWSSLWLKEGFATYFELIATSMVNKDWKLREKFVTRCNHVALQKDSTAQTHALIHPVAGNQESIDSLFDEVSYLKGASVIRMLEHIVTTDVFRKGLHRYLIEHQNSVANEYHLYDALHKEETKSKLPENYNITQVMTSWTLQPGYPLVTITAERKGQLKIVQKRFLSTTVKTENSSEVWIIPLTFVIQDGNFSDTATKIWLTGTSTKINRPCEENEWFIFNVQEIGFYQVNYDERNWKLLTQYLRSNNFTKIHEINRAQLLNDAITLAQNKVLKYSTAISLLHYLANETDFLPWECVKKFITHLNMRFMDTKMYDIFKIFILELVNKVYNKLGATEKETDGHVTKIHRSIILQFACLLGYERCIKEMQHTLLDNESSPIRPDLQSVVYCMAVSNGGEDEWNILWKKYNKSRSSSEKITILSSMGCTTQQTLIDKYIMWILGPDQYLKPNEIEFAIDKLAEHPTLLELLWNFLKNNHKKKLNFLFVNNLLSIRIKTREQFLKYENLFKDMPEINTTKVLRQIEKHIKWMESHGFDIGEAIKKELNLPTFRSAETKLKLITQTLQEPTSVETESREQEMPKPKGTATQITARKLPKWKNTANSATFNVILYIILHMTVIFQLFNFK